jgi:RNA polymerase sigma factor (sigma-70 family)
MLATRRSCLSQRLGVVRCSCRWVILRPDAEDVALLAASAGGDRDAFAVFYRRHLPAVLAVLMGETHDREIAADLAAEVFAAALIGAQRYRPDHSNALPWLCAIARNKVHDSRRRGRAEERARRRLGIEREPIEDRDLERVDELVSEGTAFLGLVRQLPAPQRSALHARVIEGRDYREIADEAGSSEAVVRQRVSRALSWLRGHTKQEDQ